MAHRIKVPLEEVFNYIANNGLKSASSKYGYSISYLKYLCSREQNHCVSAYRRQYNDKINNEIIEFCKTHPRAEAIEKFNVNKSRVNRLCQKFNIKTFAHDKDFKRLSHDCYGLAIKASSTSLTKAGRELGVSKQCVSLFLAETNFVRVWVRREDFDQLKTKYQQKSEEWKAQRS